MIKTQAVSFLVNNFAAHARFAPIVEALKRDDRFDLNAAYAVQADHPKTPITADLSFQYRLPIAGKMGDARIFEMADRSGLQILDLDDDQMAQYETFHGGQAAMAYALAAADAIRVSTPFLFDRLKAVHPRVFLAANQLLTPPPKPVDQRTLGPVRILMATMQSAQALGDVLRVLGGVLRAYGDGVHLTLVGGSFAKVRFATNNFETHPFVNFETYNKLFTRADIAILPLGTEKPTLGKSDLKFLDCIAAGTTPVADRTLYGAGIDHGQTGYLYDAPNGLHRGLQQLIENPNLRNHMRQNAYAYGMKDRLYFPHHAQRDMDWLAALWDRKDELSQERKQRMADMLRPALPSGPK